MRRSLGLVLFALLATALPVRAAPAALVTIYNDDFGVPHIVGETREAMAYGAGYVIARDRLFETDVIRKLGQGRLSEILGAGGNEATLRADRAMRREFYDAADIRRQVAELPAEIRTLLEAFSDGFNVAMAEQLADPTKKSVLFPALGYEPEPWRPEDSATVLMLFTIVTFAGEGEGGELDNARLLDRLVDAKAGDVAAALAVWNDLLLPNDPDAPAVVPHGEGPPPAQITAITPHADQIALARAPGIAAAARAQRDELDVVRAVLQTLPVPRIGSYMLAATGARSASGRGILLGAPQAGFLAPSVFYELGLHAPGVDCTGFTVPGLGPFIGIGWCNGHTWSLVAGNAGDQVDLIVEKLCDPGRPGILGAMRGTTCVPMRPRHERYVAKSTIDGRPPQVVMETIWSTENGPVFHVDEENGLAYVNKRSQAGRFVRTYVGTYGLTFARSYAELMTYARHITATYNFLYADADGRIAYRFTGLQPVRAVSIDLRLPTPGWIPEHDWQAAGLPFEQMPHVDDPADGILHVSQGVDSKPIWWWPGTSRTFVGRIGHTAADRATFASEMGLTIARLEELNEVIVSSRDTITPMASWVIDGALAGVDPTSRLGQAYALFDAWRDAGFPRTRTSDGKLAEVAISIFGADYLGFPRAPVWDEWVARIWQPTGANLPRGSWIGRLGHTLAAVEEPALFAHDYASGWEEKFRAALARALDILQQRFGTADMSAWRSAAPTVRFEPVGLLAPRAMQVVDHGTYSQIVDAGAARGVNILPAGNGRADTALDVATAQATGALPPHFADQLELYERFEFKPMKMRAGEFTANVESVQVFAYPRR